MWQLSSFISMVWCKDRVCIAGLLVLKHNTLPSIFHVHFVVPLLRFRVQHGFLAGWLLFENDLLTQWVQNSETKSTFKKWSW